MPITARTWQSSLPSAVKQRELLRRVEALCAFEAAEKVIYRSAPSGVGLPATQRLIAASIECDAPRLERRVGHNTTNFARNLHCRSDRARHSDRRKGRMDAPQSAGDAAKSSPTTLGRREPSSGASAAERADVVHLAKL